MDQHTASVLGSVFALSNLFARALGGMLSDFAAKHFGMRGRLWTLWTVQSLGEAAYASAAGFSVPATGPCPPSWRAQLARGPLCSPSARSGAGTHVPRPTCSCVHACPHPAQWYRPRAASPDPSGVPRP